MNENKDTDTTTSNGYVKESAKWNEIAKELVTQQETANYENDKGFNRKRILFLEEKENKILT